MPRYRLKARVSFQEQAVFSGFLYDWSVFFCFPVGKISSHQRRRQSPVGLDHQGFLPSFVRITDGKPHDVTVAHALALPTNSIAVMDRAYIGYVWQWFFLLFNNKVTPINSLRSTLIFGVKITSTLAFTSSSLAIISTLSPALATDLPRAIIFLDRDLALLIQFEICVPR